MEIKKGDILVCTETVYVKDRPEGKPIFVEGKTYQFNEYGETVNEYGCAHTGSPEFFDRYFKKLDIKSLDIEPPDPVNHPSHYTQGKVESIDAIESALGPEGFKGFLAGNTMKYIHRYRHKNGLEDLKKSRWYLDRLIKILESNEER